MIEAFFPKFPKIKGNITFECFLCDNVSPKKKYVISTDFFSVCQVTILCFMAALPEAQKKI